MSARGFSCAVVVVRRLRSGIQRIWKSIFLFVLGEMDRDGSRSSSDGTATQRKLRSEVYHLRARMTAYLKVPRLIEKRPLGSFATSRPIFPASIEITLGWIGRILAMMV